MRIAIMYRADKYEIVTDLFIYSDEDRRINLTGLLAEPSTSF